MKALSYLLVVGAFSVFLSSSFARKISYDCSSAPHEMAGFHNMVLFGHPDDQLYSYHLPLFQGDINGNQGHVLMHVYQGLWKVQLDLETTLAYKEKFQLVKSSNNPFPFFSFSPQGHPFKVPEMFCNSNFETDVLAVYGHIEGNPNFPSPSPLVQSKSKLMVDKMGPLVAQRFNGTAKSSLTYILFGNENHQFLVHYLTDNENSFDQIVSISIPQTLQSLLLNNTGTLELNFSKIDNTNLIPINNGAATENNSLGLPTTPLGQTVVATYNNQKYELKILGSIYFNGNADLKIQ